MINTKREKKSLDLFIAYEFAQVAYRNALAEARAAEARASAALRDVRAAQAAYNVNEAQP
jgi:hypothetical protein